MNSLDTIGYCKRLEAVGVPREQAEVHAQILTEVMNKVATKDGLKELEAATKDGLKELEVATRKGLKELEVDLKALEASTKDGLKELEAGLKALEAATKRDSKELEVRLKEWVALYVKEQIAGVKADIATLRADMLKWFFAGLIAQSSLIITALRYLPH